MKLIRPSFSIWEQESGLQGIYKAIEKAGRICYKSSDKITEDSAKPFVERMIKSGHGAMLEHGTIYLKLIGVFLDPTDCDVRYGNYVVDHYIDNKYSKVIIRHDEKWKSDVYITTNYRVIIQNGWLNDLKFLCEPTEYHEKRTTVHFVCDRGILAEFTRHRVFSFAAESTRYCNYSKNKFNNEVTFVLPCWVDSLALQEVKGTVINSDDFGNLIGEYYYHLNGKEAPYFKTWEITPERNFITSLQIAEQLYLELLNQGWKPQQARAVLPNALKTELVMTGSVSQWKDFFLLRSNKYGKGGAHPSADELATPLYEEFVASGYIK